ncbi:glycosyltransferase [Paenibacillus sp. HB172176]|uniref:glycosyltransferase n=1 Tax=Paenibacillus sp. HB172176 TaxID=2493690 RepID=UPI00143A8806|nr:glycosyltransferase [Paenibacillus sp. HB172176]
MKKSLLIVLYDMEIGGVERSLVNMLNSFDYERFEVDLLVFRHTGEFLKLIPKEVRLLPEVGRLTVFRKSLKQCAKEGYYFAVLQRIRSKAVAYVAAKRMKASEGPGYIQMQLDSKYFTAAMPRPDKQYDVSISYAWPHDYTAGRVTAKQKLAWIHTDFSKLEVDHALDRKMWEQYDEIIAVSETCKASFLEKYASLHERVFVIENITSPATIRSLAEEIPEEKAMLEDNRFKLLTVARLSHAKGIDNAVKALKKLIQGGHREFVWFIVGYGGDEEQIRTLIAQEGMQEHFILLGKQTNPYPYMKACNLYVQPSRYEGKAVTVTEAQILGKPVLITNYATAPSQVRHMENGYIAELSVDGIAEGILKLYENCSLREQLADTCRRTDFGNREELEKLYELLRAERRAPVCV